jgi:plastocyanin
MIYIVPADGPSPPAATDLADHGERLVADPEQIYQEVLTEEQGKGVSAPVAEGRAKAARARAEQGSPHPKEPKWWPGAQPHLEGGDGAAPAEESAEEVAEEPAAEEPAPAAEAAPEPEPEPASTPAAPAAEAPAAAAQEAPAAVATAPAPAARATEVAPEQRPTGVTHGVPAGNRLRPEDAVGTEAQFEGQQAVYQRRKLIDEVVSDSVPVTGGPRSGQWALFLVYLAVVVGAIFFVIGQEDTVEGGAPPEEPAGGGGGGVTVTAQNVSFDTDTITLTAGEETPIEFVNEDASSVSHNIAIYEDDSAAETLFQGDVIPGGQSATYEVPALDKGSFYFQCDVHPGMNGDVKVE